jgi:flagellar secretion chaperone FliS
MSFNPQSAYLEAGILTCDPIKLVQILYDLGIRTVAAARECCRKNDIAGRAKHVNKAFEVFVELQNGLNPEQGGEIARNYARIYDYCQRRLLQAHVEQSETLLAEVEALLSDLREAWQVVVTQCSTQIVPTDQEIAKEVLVGAGDENRYSCVG